MNYFAYGSNLSSRRIKYRIQKAEFVCSAVLPNYELSFSKTSIDGSGKCTVHSSENKSVHGVVYSIDPESESTLDYYEELGFGYSKHEMNLQNGDGEISAFFYIAQERYVDRNLNPYHWYKKFVISGAKEHSLPSNYIEWLSSFASKDDGNSERVEKNHRILNG